MTDTSKTNAVMPLVKSLVKCDLMPLIEQVLCHRAEQYLREVENYKPDSRILQPTYYVGHPDGSYSIADPQPVLMSEQQ